jgi:hypothetical protein
VHFVVDRNMIEVDVRRNQERGLRLSIIIRTVTGDKFIPGIADP